MIVIFYVYSVYIHRNPHMWLIGLIYALPLGFFGNWSSNLHLELDPLGITQVNLFYRYTLTFTLAVIITPKCIRICTKVKKYVNDIYIAYVSILS